MTYTRDTPLRGTTTVTADQAIAYATSMGARGTYRQYIRFIWKWAPDLRLNPLAVFGQWLDETGGGTSERWLNGDPAGIGIFSDSTVSTLPSGLSGDQSAAIHLVELATKVNRAVPPSSLVDDIDVAAIDPHLARVEQFVARPDWPTIATLHDLRIPLAGSDFTWAANQAYGDQIAAHMNAVQRFADSLPQNQEEPTVSTIVFGNVKHPTFRDRLIQNAENFAWDDLGPRRPVGVDQHSMIGTLSGTDLWFRRGRQSTGLTDYGIGGSTDGALDGVIYRWNDPTGRRSGWANGGSDGLEGDGPLFVRNLGINAINQRLVSIERSDGGNIATPMSPKQFESVCSLSAHWFDVARVGFDTFPYNTATACVTHLLHKETATKDCPFRAVYDRIDEIQNRIRAILKAGQLSAVEEPTVLPVIPPTPDHNKWPYPVADLKARFGAVPIYQVDGSVKRQPFHERGAISNAWANRAKKDGMKKVSDIPPPLQGFEVVDKDGLKQTIITFDGRGKGVWVLFRPAREVSWRWLT